MFLLLSSSVRLFFLHQLRQDEPEKAAVSRIPPAELAAAASARRQLPRIPGKPCEFIGARTRYDYIPSVGKAPDLKDESVWVEKYMFVLSANGNTQVITGDLGSTRFADQIATVLTGFGERILFLFRLAVRRNIRLIRLFAKQGQR